MRRKSSPRRLRNRHPNHQRHPRRSHGSFRARLAQLFRRLRRFHGRHLHRQRRSNQRQLRHLPTRNHPTDRNQIHPQIFFRKSRNQRRRHLVHQRRPLRRHPQPRSSSSNAGFPPRKTNRLGLGRVTHHRNRRHRARRHARKRKISLRRRPISPAHQNRRKFRNQKSFPGILFRLWPA